MQWQLEQQLGQPAVLARGNLRWYLNRLRCMPAREIPFRLLRTVATHAERFQLQRYHAPPSGVEAGPCLAAAERIMGGHCDVFALRDVRLGTAPSWNRDPKTGTDAPLSFGKLLDYRDPQLVGDIKYLWEPNRHLQLVTLAQAYALTREVRFSNALMAQLDSWFKACPCPLGPNWASALEPAIRLINWSIAWQLLGGAHAEVFADAAGAAFRERWLAAVHQHVRFVRGFLSRHSSANNHLIGEITGVFIAAATWPHWPDSRRWLQQAQALLLHEALLQNAPDGVNREQAVCYQQFEFDMLLLALLAARAQGMEFPAEFSARLIAMLEYLAAIMDAGGHLPMFGDADDGRLVALSQQPDFCPYRSLLATGAALFDRADFAARAGGLDDKTRWLLGAAGEAQFLRAASRRIRPSARRAFPDGGYYVLGCDFETPREIRLVADAGPLGFGPLAAHGHADALSFTLSLGGHEVLVDPGTFTYRADNPWRAYFRGTSAHNTLRVDGMDQSEPGGSFLWLHKAAAHCTTWLAAADQDCFEGWHDGYTRLPDPVLHRRRIVLDKPRRRILIEDRLEMAGTHRVELFFHCSEQCRIEAEAQHWLLQVGDQRLRMMPPQEAGATARIARGEQDPPLGWISRSFDVRVPTATLAWRATLRGATTLRTVIEC
jgi:hypothetical protein